jgi:DNA-binding NarL/FixJ family response regulator
MKTLIIGDNADVMQAIADLLRENYDFEINKLPYQQKFLHKDIEMLRCAELIILDLTAARANLRLLISEIRTVFPEVKIMALHFYKEPSLIQTLINAGANAYLPIDTLHQEMSQAIENLTQGRNYLSVEIGI